MKGLKNHYQTHGLGVPLIAVRRSYQGEPAAARYYPPDLSFPVTAFLRPLPAAGRASAQPGRAGAATTRWRSTTRGSATCWCRWKAT